MKLKKCLLFLLFNLLAVAAFAQSDSLKVYRNEIGADFLPVIKSGVSAGLLYRRQQEKAAWRLRLNSVFHSRYFSSTNLGDEHFQADIRMGREWHVPYKSVQFYYGLDLLTGYINSRTFSIMSPRYANNMVTGGLLPLLGCTVVFDERFAASLEANGSYLFYYYRTGGRRFLDFEGIFVSGPALFLSYRF